MEAKILNFLRENYNWAKFTAEELFDWMEIDWKDDEEAAAILEVLEEALDELAESDEKWITKINNDTYYFDNGIRVNFSNLMNILQIADIECAACPLHNECMFYERKKDELCGDRIIKKYLVHDS